MGDDAAVPAAAAKLEKSYFDVLGICCPSEVPLVEKLLEPLAGVHKVTVVVPSRTVIVVHDAAAISQSQIGKYFPPPRPPPSSSYSLLSLSAQISLFLLALLVPWRLAFFSLGDGEILIQL